MKRVSLEIINFIKKWHNPDSCAIVSGVPVNDENMRIIKEIAQKVCPVHRRWRGPGWQLYHRLKDGAERVSVYPRDRSIKIWINKNDSALFIAKPERIGREF